MFGKKRIWHFTAPRTATLHDLLIYTLPPSSSFESLLKAQAIWLHKQRLTDPNTVIQKGSTLRVFLSTHQHKTFTLLPEHIFQETPDWIVLIKPQGLLVAPDATSIHNNLSYAVANYLKTFKPTAITRLDYAVGGLVLFAKHKDAEKKLFKAMQDGQIKKLYWAILETSLPSKTFVKIQEPLLFSKKAIVDPNGKSALSYFFLKKEITPKLTWASVVPVTGRRHQIRAHAAFAKYPVAGDTTYGSQEKLKTKALALLCVGYSFTFNKKRVRIRWTAAQSTLESLIGNPL